MPPKPHDVAPPVRLDDWLTAQETGGTPVEILAAFAAVCRHDGVWHDTTAGWTRRWTAFQAAPA
jgi:hypothetical protein